MIHKSASIISNFQNRISFYNSAREAWCKILKSIPSKRTIKVLLPSYIGITEREGSGIFDPVCQANCEFDFYNLNDDLSLNFNSIQSKMATSKYDFILVVHYFGLQQQDLDLVIDECKKTDTLIVEDCAHFINFDFVGDIKRIKGDFAFYSLHKVLPINLGGCLIVNPKLKRADLDFSGFTSTFSENSFVSYDVPGIVKKKRENYLTYEKLIQNIDGLTIFKNLQEEDVPHNFPIIIENGLREKLYFWLIERNVPLIALYYRLIEPLQNENYGSMLNLSNTILNLPVHQDVGIDEIHVIVELIREGISELKK